MSVDVENAHFLVLHEQQVEVGFVQKVDEQLHERVLTQADAVGQVLGAGLVVGVRVRVEELDQKLALPEERETWEKQFDFLIL